MLEANSKNIRKNLLCYCLEFFKICKKYLSNQNMNVYLCTMKIHNSKNKNCANSNNLSFCKKHHIGIWLNN